MMPLTNEEWSTAIKDKTSLLLNSSDESKQKTTFIVPNGEFTQYIDHTLLKSDATPAQIDQLCDQAIKFKFKSCCVNGVNIRRVAERLSNSECVACAVIGFPLGACKANVKEFETREAIQDGAKEVDMVMNIGALKSGDYSLVYEDIKAVVEAASGHVVKVILETVFLSDEEIIAASYIAAEAGAMFVKTCTGFCGGGATAADIALMRRTVAYKQGVKVKASAGIRSFEKCLEMLQAGAERIGTSSSVLIMENSGRG